MDGIEGPKPCKNCGATACGAETNGEVCIQCWSRKYPEKEPPPWLCGYKTKIEPTTACPHQHPYPIGTILMTDAETWEGARFKVLSYARPHGIKPGSFSPSGNYTVEGTTGLDYEFVELPGELKHHHPSAHIGKVEQASTGTNCFHCLCEDRPPDKYRKRR